MVYLKETIFGHCNLVTALAIQRRYNWLTTTLNGRGICKMASLTFPFCICLLQQFIVLLLSVVAAFLAVVSRKTLPLLNPLWSLTFAMAVSSYVNYSKEQVSTKSPTEHLCKGQSLGPNMSLVQTVILCL